MFGRYEKKMAIHDHCQLPILQVGVVRFQSCLLLSDLAACAWRFQMLIKSLAKMDFKVDVDIDIHVNVDVDINMDDIHMDVDVTNGGS